MMHPQSYSCRQMLSGKRPALRPRICMAFQNAPRRAIETLIVAASDRTNGGRIAKDHKSREVDVA